MQYFWYCFQDTQAALPSFKIARQDLEFGISHAATHNYGRVVRFLLPVHSKKAIQVPLDASLQIFTGQKKSASGAFSDSCKCDKSIWERQLKFWVLRALSFLLQTRFLDTCSVYHVIKKEGGRKYLLTQPQIFWTAGTRPLQCRLLTLFRAFANRYWAVHGDAIPKGSVSQYKEREG